MVFILIEFKIRVFEFNMLTRCHVTMILLYATRTVDHEPHEMSHGLSKYAAHDVV